MATYTFLIRDPFTLAILGELPNAEGTWTRRVVEAGVYSLAVNRQTVADPSLLVGPKLIDIRRDGAVEFVGVLTADELGNPSLGRRGETWVVEGQDLKWFLAGRDVVDGVNYDAVTDVAAETAMLGYVARHLTAPSDTTRDINGELDGITFDLAGDLGRGALVTANHRMEPLTTVLSGLAAEGGLWHEVVYQDADAGYRYAVRAYQDRTDGSADPFLLGLSWENVESLMVRRDIGGVANRVSVLATDSSGVEFVRTVNDAASQAQHFIRERSLSGSGDATNDTADAEGIALINETLAGTITIDAQPFPGPNGEYRTDYDLGDDVTVVVPDIDLSIDKRIVEVTVTLDRQQGERVSVTLGSPAPTMDRVIATEIRRVRRW